MKILVYTHSDVSWVWPFWIKQTQKYFPDHKKVVFINSDYEGDAFEEAGYTSIKYNDSQKYTDRMTSCLEQLDPEDVIIFHHEDMFLYDDPDHDRLAEYESLVSEDQADLIKLLRNGNTLIPHLPKMGLYKNPPEYGFAIQPTVIKVRTLLRIYRHVPGETIWQFETNAQRLVSEWDLVNLFIADAAPQRGMHHWDSNIYPYVATAVVKGQWNFMEYASELEQIGVANA